MLLGEREPQLLWVHLWLEPVCRSILALLEAGQPLEALAAMGPCPWQAGAQGLAPQAELFRVHAVTFLQVVFSHEAGRQFHASVFGSKFCLNIDLPKTVPYQNAEECNSPIRLFVQIEVSVENMDQTCRIYGWLYEKFTDKKSFVSVHNGFQPKFNLLFSFETFNCLRGMYS